jgi:pimeloyl-ACP methyl ester carboxylesterase
MRWSEEGGGFPFVLLHGIPTSPALWRHVLPQVRGGRLLAFELVGYGESIPAGRDRDISVARQADSPARLAGPPRHRAGGAGRPRPGRRVAQIAAVHQPRRRAGLVLANAVCYDSWPILSVRALRAAGPLVGRMRPPLFRALVARCWPAATTTPQSTGGRRPSTTTL